ncbi:MAG: GNAT family N-acetyltransferase [Cyanobacteria bacterium J06621_12]
MTIEQILPIYETNQWSAAQKPKMLNQALLNSHSLVTAWDKERLVGIGNAISDGYLVVYYPHLLVHVEYQRQGIGREIMRLLQRRYEGFHMQILVADTEAVHFYQKCGFTKAGNTESMWIYDGNEH